MKKRCTPHFVKKIHSKNQSWRKAAKELNALYEVSLNFLTWRDYATKRRDILNPSIRAALFLEPRPCPSCGNMPTAKLSRLLERMSLNEWKSWHEFRKQKKYKAARRLIDEVFSRSVIKKR
jgi:hypothetical protein